MHVGNQESLWDENGSVIFMDTPEKNLLQIYRGMLLIGHLAHICGG
jgi:hypothetical protein